MVFFYVLSVGFHNVKVSHGIVVIMVLPKILEPGETLFLNCKCSWVFVKRFQWVMMIIVMSGTSPGSLDDDCDIRNVSNESWRLLWCQELLQWVMMIIVMSGTSPVSHYKNCDIRNVSSESLLKLWYQERLQWVIMMIAMSGTSAVSHEYGCNVRNVINELWW